MTQPYRKHNARDMVLRRLDLVPREKQAGPRPPVYNIYQRHVTARLWANFTEWNDLVWRIDLLREYTAGPEKRGGSRYFGAQDIDLLILALLRAKKLIRSVERRRFLRRFFPWM